MCRPQLLLLDEPFSNIDAQVRWTLVLEIRALLKSLNMGGRLCHPQAEEAFAFADRFLRPCWKAASDPDRYPETTLPSTGHALRGRVPGAG